MSPMQRTKRPNGRHETGAQTVPDPAEEPMTSPAKTRPAAPAEVLDDLLDMHERALHRAREASGGVAPMEEKIRSYVSAGDQLRGEAEELRRRAADADLRAENQFQAATEIGKQRDQLRTDAQRQQARADYHGSRIDEEIRLGAEDPKVRRERLAKQAAEAGRQVVPESFSPSALDGPNPAIGPEPTAPFPQHDLDAAQATQVSNGEPR